MKRTIYLHIGMEKTGTTSLQRYFVRNREELLRQKMLYPSTGCGQNHWGLLVYALDPAKQDHMKTNKKLDDELACKSYQSEFESSLKNELKNTTADIIVLSLEQLSSRVNQLDEIKKIRSLLSYNDDEVKIVAYLRPQHEYLTSWYSTRVKGGWETQPLKIPQPGDPEFDRFDYAKTISPWAEIFGENSILIRLFQKPDLINNNILDDFFNLIKKPESANFKRPKKLNTSLDAITLEIVRRLNSYIGPHTTSGGPNLNRKALRMALNKMHNSPHLFLKLNKMDRDYFMSKFESSNKFIAQNYMGSEYTKIFSQNESSNSGIDFSQYQLSFTDEEVVQRTAKMFIELSHIIHRLQKMK